MMESSRREKEMAQSLPSLMSVRVGIIQASLLIVLCATSTTMVSAQSIGHDPYANVVSNPYTSDHSPFRFGQPTAVELYRTESYETKYRSASRGVSPTHGASAADHRGNQHTFSFERWNDRCEGACRSVRSLERRTVHAPTTALVPSATSAAPSDMETAFGNAAVKAGVLTTPKQTVRCVDAPVVDITSVCECPHGKKANILSADGVVHGKLSMDVNVLSERFGRKPLEPAAEIAVGYRLPVQLVALQQCKSRVCEPPAARFPYVIWRSHTSLLSDGDVATDNHGFDELIPEYHIHEDDLDVDVTVAASVCAKSFLRRKEFAAILKRHVVDHLYAKLADVARGSFAQLLVNEGLCVFESTSKDGGEGDLPPVQQILPSRQLVHVRDGGDARVGNEAATTPFDLSIPVGWHRPLAVSGIEQVFRLDGFEPTVVFVDSARLRKLYVERTDIDPARMFPLSGQFAVKGSVALDLGVSVMRKHRQFFGRSVCTSDGSCIKVPWYGDQYYTQPFADVRDATIHFEGVARIHDDGYAHLSHLNGDLDRSSDTFEYRPDVEIGKHIWIREVVDKNKLADSLISEGVIMSILDGLRRELQYEIDQYQFVPATTGA